MAMGMRTGMGSEQSSTPRILWPWLLVSTLLVYFLQGVPTLVAFGVEMASRGEESWLARHGLFDAIPLWTHPEWLIAIVVYAAGLGVFELVLQRRLRTSIFWTGGAATVAYLIAASLVLTAGSVFTAQTAVENAQWIVGFGIGVWGNAWVAFLVPLLVGALVGNRGHFYGRLGTKPTTSDPNTDAVVEDW
jgi:hypothetical protein